MNKIRNLFKNLFKKKKKSQDLDDVFYDDVDEETYEEEEFEAHDEEISAAESPPDSTFIQNEANDVQDEASFTQEIDIDAGPPSFKEGFKNRVDGLKVKITDKFRKFNRTEIMRGKSESTPKGKLSNEKLRDFTSAINLNQIKSKASSINWAELPDKFFQMAKLPRYHRWFQMGMALFLVYAFASVVGGLLRGQKKYNEYGRQANINIDSSQQISTKDISKIADSNVFQTQAPEINNTPDKPKNTNTVCKQASKRSSLNIELVDTIVLQDSVKSIASVQMNSKQDLLIGREGDVINNNFKIGKIEREKLIFRNLQSQDCEFIEQKQSKQSKRRSSPPRIMSKPKAAAFKREQKSISGIAQDGNQYKIKRDFLKSKLSDINTILTQAKGIQVKNPDGTISFKIVDVDPGGIFAYLGVQDGDMITQINGEPIKELNEVMSLFGKLTSLSNLTLGFNRGGDNVTQNYTIE